MRPFGINWRKFHKKNSRYHSLQSVWKYHIWKYELHLPRDNELINQYWCMDDLYFCALNSKFRPSFSFMHQVLLHVVVPLCGNKLFSTGTSCLNYESDNLKWVKSGFMSRLYSLELCLLTLWGWDNMAAIFQTTFSDAFSWMKIYELRLIFHWALFLRV